jgi:hypothetical protein
VNEFPLPDGELLRALVQRFSNNPAGAEIPFDWILDQITGSDSTVTDYILETPGKCPNCRRQIFEKTLVEPRD